MSSSSTEPAGPAGGPGLTAGGIGWRRRLGVRLTCAVAVVTLVTLSTVALLTVEQQRRHSLESLRRSAEFFAETVRSSTHDQMLQNRKEETYRVMERIGHQRGVERVRIFNREGRVTFSTVAAETGRVFASGAPPCVTCHAGARPVEHLDPGSRSRLDGGVLSVLAPVYNEPTCATAGCHAHVSARSMLGVIEIGLSLRDTNIELARSARETALLAAAALVIVALLAYAIVRRFVLRPVDDLVDGTRRVAGGEFGPDIPVRAPDELGHLAVSFNEMRHALVRMHRERQDLMAGLERQVDERTAALRAAQENMVQTEKLASLGTLSASIAHEINNPLAGILTFSKLIAATLDRGAPDDATRALCVKQVKLIQRETERCSNIVRHLLDFARERRLDLVEIDVNEPLDEALSLARPRIDEQGIHLHRERGEDLRVRADFGQLRQAFLNIVLNACDAMGKGGTLTVATRRRTLRDEIEVVVQDTGPGIPAVNLARIFDPFFTTKETGTGLGLSVVYGIADKHGGRIEVQSAADKGTMMVVVLPVAPASDASVETVAATGPEHRPA